MDYLIFGASLLVNAASPPEPTAQEVARAWTDATAHARARGQRVEGAIDLFKPIGNSGPQRVTQVVVLRGTESPKEVAQLVVDAWNALNQLVRSRL